MNSSNEILARSADLNLLKKEIQDTIKFGDEWFIWENRNDYLNPSLTYSSQNHQDAEKLCWNPERKDPFFRAVPVKAMNEALMRAIPVSGNGKQLSPAIAIDLNGCEHIGCENAALQADYDGIKEQLTNIGAWNSEMPEELKWKLYNQFNPLDVTLPVTQEYHPLDVYIRFQKNEGQYQLKQLEVRGIKVPDLVVDGINLVELQKEASRFNWRFPSSDKEELNAKLGIVDNLIKIRKSPDGRDLAARLLLKYDIAQFIPEQWPSKEERSTMESRQIFPQKEDSPLSIKEACQLFVENRLGREAAIVFAEKKKSQRKF